jgi:chemotaxis protein MotA
VKASWTRTVDTASLGALAIGVGLVLFGQALEGGKIRSLFQGAAAFVVFGGTLGAVLLSFPPLQIARATTSLRRVLRRDAPDLRATVATIVAHVTRARRHGILSLEPDLDLVEEPFLRRGLGLAVDGTAAPVVRDLLEFESRQLHERDVLDAHVFEVAGGYAPTFGILGAVLGLIQVMEHLSDPSRLGPGIATAFVATVYGVGAANLVFLPIASRLKAEAAAAARHREVIIEGVAAVQEGLHPRLVALKLASVAFMPDQAAPGSRGHAA